VVGGTLDVAQNAQGVRVEAAYARPVMTSMHAFYSLGAILGSLAGGGLAWAGVALLPSLAAVGVVGALIDGTAGPWLLAGKPSPVAHEVNLSESSGVPSDTAVTENSPDARRRVRRLVLALGVLGVCGLVGEGAAGDWSAVYLKDNLGTSAGFAALGFASFSVTMTLGRGVGDRLIRRFGVVSVIRVCGLIATAGLALALATPVPAVAIAGFTAFGAGLSIVVPQVFAAGGRADPFRPGSGLARVVGLGYTGMAAGPAIIGLVANNIGLHLALLIPLALAAWIAVAAPALRASQATSHAQATKANV
jgi:fucose permease